MKKILVRKEEQGGRVYITFRFKALGQLLDLEDPTPLPWKEMTGEAEEAIAGHLDEYMVRKPASLILELPAGDLSAEGVAMLITGAVRHHFGFRRDDLAHDLKISRREGLYSLVISIGNIAFLVTFFYYITVNQIPYDSFHVTLLLGFFTILNWVTIWDTYEHFVYDYRNLIRKRRIFRKITNIPLEVRAYQP